MSHARRNGQRTNGPVAALLDQYGLAAVPIVLSVAVGRRPAPGTGRDIQTIHSGFTRRCESARSKSDMLARVLIVWFVVTLACTAWVLYDLRARNADLATLMQGVWALTTLYSGPSAWPSTCIPGASRLHATTSGGAVSAPWHIATRGAAPAKSSDCW